MFLFYDKKSGPTQGSLVVYCYKFCTLFLLYLGILLFLYREAFVDARFKATTLVFNDVRYICVM